MEAIQVIGRIKGWIVLTMFTVVALMAAALRIRTSTLAGAKAKDLGRANDVRRRAQVVKENHREETVRIDDDVLDKRLHDLRSQK
jgi:hypothetical protein